MEMMGKSCLSLKLNCHMRRLGVRPSVRSSVSVRPSVHMCPGVRPFICVRRGMIISTSVRTALELPVAGTSYCWIGRTYSCWIIGISSCWTGGTLAVAELVGLKIFRFLCWRD